VDDNQHDVATPPAVVSDSFEALIAEIEAQINPQGDEEDAWRADMLRRLRALVEKERAWWASRMNDALAAKEFDKLTLQNELSAKTEELEGAVRAFGASIENGAALRADNDRLRAVMLECADKCSAEADIYSVWAEPLAARLREEAGK
jgi:AcrR family transcriptional regulator